MQKFSKQLPPVHSCPDGHKIYFLTGKDYLYQTLFCIRSLIKFAGEKFNFQLVDDGSIDSALTERIKHQLPGASIISKELIENNLSDMLPVEDFPYINRKRKQYVHLKKLTDVHSIPGDPWKLLLDSDMLFFGEPLELLNWLTAPDRPVHMKDCAESYGYSISLMESLAGSAIKPLINVGVAGMNSKAIDWVSVERWIKELETAEGGSYYLEQALTAMLIGPLESKTLDEKDYVVNPTVLSSGVLHHYVDLSKEYYFKHGWREQI